MYGRDRSTESPAIVRSRSPNAPTSTDRKRPAISSPPSVVLLMAFRVRRRKGRRSGDGAWPSSGGGATRVRIEVETAVLDPLDLHGQLAGTTGFDQADALSAPGGGKRPPPPGRRAVPEVPTGEPTCQRADRLLKHRVRGAVHRDGKTALNSRRRIPGISSSGRRTHVSISRSSAFKALLLMVISTSAIRSVERADSRSRDLICSQRPAKTTGGVRMATERKGKPGRPVKVLDPQASLLAALGAKLRELRKARELTLMELGELTGYSWQHLGAVERGSVAPSESVIVACDTALGAGGALNGLLPAVIREQAHLRHSGEAARRSGEAQELDVDWGRLSACGTHASTPTPAVLDDIEAITTHQRRLYHELTSAQMLVPVDGHLGLLLSVLRAPVPDRLRRRVASAAGEAAGFSAWIWFDLGDHFKMGRRYGIALDALAEAGDAGLRSYVSAYRAVTADAAGRAGEAVRHASAALDVAGRSVTGVTAAWFHAVNATAHAHAGDGRTALAELGRAHTTLERAGEERDEWMYDFDHERLLGYEGNCLLELGRHSEAARSFERAFGGVPATCVRRRAEIGVDLAQALLGQGETAEAVRLAQESIAVFARRGSTSGMSRVRRLRDHMVGHGHTVAARELDDFVRTWKE
ncbi:helix-turn-helix domain-containing protein [Streptosporangium sp. NPDC051022]|uniref:helix-turn-helix domain-containing protein n=1 Tax=Streptosporangium sp. NPDC051022 TaxID=3155752 RepID=UPI003416312A